MFDSLTEELLELIAIPKGAGAAYFAELTSCCCCCCCISPKPL